MRMEQSTICNNTAATTRNRDYDVVCGKHSFNNPGNEYFRKLVQLNRKQYRSTTVREEKRRIIQHIMESIHRRGGRFLQQPPVDDEEEEILSYAAQYEKVSHALRSARSSTLVQTRADMAGTVNTLLDKQRQLFQQYCRDNDNNNDKAAKNTFTHNSHPCEPSPHVLPTPVLSRTASLSLDTMSLGFLLSALDAPLASS